MKYVKRDIDGNILAVYARPQKGIAVELLVNDNKELQTFLNPPETWKELREKDYAAKGWLTPYDLIDDILARGNTAVKIERDAIKNRYPKI